MEEYNRDWIALWPLKIIFLKKIWRTFPPFVKFFIHARAKVSTKVHLLFTLFPPFSDGITTPMPFLSKYLIIFGRTRGSSSFGDPNPEYLSTLDVHVKLARTPDDWDYKIGFGKAPFLQQEIHHIRWAGVAGNQGVLFVGWRRSSDGDGCSVLLFLLVMVVAVVMDTMVVWWWCGGSMIWLWLWWWWFMRKELKKKNR